MSDYSSFAGQRATSLHAVIPMYGRASVDVVLATSAAVPVTASPLVIGDLTLLCTSFRTASFSGSRSARLAGGYGGWHKAVSAQAYVGPTVRMSTVLGDAATLVGERVTLDVADGNLARFTREAAPASRVLRQVAGPLWWVAPDGVTHVGPRVGVAIKSAFDVLSWSGKTGHFTIATEVLADWTPGRTFTAPTVTGTQTIGYTEIKMGNNGKLRVEVLAS